MGCVRTFNVIEYAVPLSGKNLTGNKFWEDLAVKGFSASDHQVSRFG